MTDCANTTHVGPPPCGPDCIFIGGEAEPVCPGCDMTDSNGADSWVQHNGEPWHGACVAIEAAMRAGLL